MGFQTEMTVTAFNHERQISLSQASCTALRLANPELHGSHMMLI